MTWPLLISLASTSLAIGVWIARPQQRSLAFFLLGVSATAGSVRARLFDVRLSIALSLLGIVLFLTSVWLQRQERRQNGQRPQPKR